MTANNSSKGSFSVIYRRLLAYVTPHWHAFVIASVSLVVVAATEVGVAALMKPMLDGTFVERDPVTIKWVPIGLVAIFLVRGIATYLAGYSMAWVGRKVIKVLREQMFNKLLLLPVSFFDTSPSGVLISKLIYDVEQVANATTEVITILIRDTVTVIGLLAWMFYLDWLLAIILLIGAPAVAHIITTINRRFRRYSTSIQDSMGYVSHIAEETIEGQRVVKTFGGHEYERTRFENANEENRHLNMKLLATTAASVPLIQLIASMAAALVIYVALSLPEMSVGGFVSFLSAMMMILAPMKRLAKISASLQKGVAAAASIFTFIDTNEEPDQGKVNLCLDG
jgi:subfamily B ATP-binding cassette protein MsbA